MRNPRSARVTASFPYPARVIVVIILAVGPLACREIPIPVDPCASDPSACVSVYVGASACISCHDDLAIQHSRHGHSQALKVVEGTAPIYPNVGRSAGVPLPPDGLNWSDLSFIIGGYGKMASFVNSSGCLLTDGNTGNWLQYHLAHLPTGLAADYQPLTTGYVGTTIYTYSCFRCHTTDPKSLTDNGGQHQDNRPCVEGTWYAPGVQCEACHGPGSVHIGNPAGGHIRIDQIANVCSNCHADMANPYQLPAWDGFIAGNRQWAEVQASPHAGFACTVCHDPHTSVLYDRTTSLRNDCTACHSDQNMALHADKLFVQGDYVERLSCQSCHMPLAGRNAVSVLLPAPCGDTARIGDTRTHIMYIDTLRRDYTGMLTGDGRELVRDQAGKAVVTVDFACLRCHHGKGSAFLLTLGGAGAIAEGIHRSGTQQVTNKMNTGQ